MRKLIVFIFCIVAVWTEAQTYSNNREKFVKEFQKSLTEFGKGDFHDFAKKDLPFILLETTDFPQEYFDKMVETCNLMQTKNLSPYPETYEYVFSVYSLVKGKQTTTSYNAWQSSVTKLLDNKNIKKFTDFIELSAGFFSVQRIAASSNFNWYYNGGTYTFEFTDKPFIKFSGGNLACKVQNRGASDKNTDPFLDSMVIYQTQGTYDPILKKWQGTGGIVTWEKVGLPKNETFATFQKYDVSCKSSTLTIDSVLLTTKYFAKPIAGSLSDRAFTINRKEDRVYPQFISFEKRLRIKNVRENVDYDGGFSMQGASFVGIGSSKDPARVLIYRTLLFLLRQRLNSLTFLLIKS